MRRAITLLAVLSIVVAAVDVYVRGQVRAEIAAAAQAGFSASSADVDLPGPLVLPQMLSGRLSELDIQLGDGVIGDPAIRATSIDIHLEGVAVELPPPAVLDQVDIAGGVATVTLHEREVERLLQRDRPGWSVRIEPSGIRATGEVQGVPVVVTVEIVPEGAGLRLRAREVDAGPLGAEGARAVAAGFDTTLSLSGLPDLVRIAGTSPGKASLDLSLEIREGVLQLR